LSALRGTAAAWELSQFGREVEAGELLTRSPPTKARHTLRQLLPLAA